MARKAAPQRAAVNVKKLVRPDREQQREHARQRVVVTITEAIAEVMEHANIRRTDVAEKLGKTKGQISQVLSGRRNMTLHTLADLLWACGYAVDGVNLSRLGRAAGSVGTARK